jgi:rifampin ADP-ribosylating transferase
MEFDPRNKVVKLCIQGMAFEENGKPEEASRLFLQAWNEASNDFEKFLAAHYVARHQKNVSDKLKWLETTLAFALKVNNDSVRGAFPSLYLSIAKCYEDIGDPDNAKKNYESAISFRDKLPDNGPFYHGTRADLQVGDLLTAGSNSNYKTEVIMNHIYFTALVNGAGLQQHWLKVTDGSVFTSLNRPAALKMTRTLRTKNFLAIRRAHIEVRHH